jgi:hypothetical protein
MPVLKLEKDDPVLEREFEVRCALQEEPVQRLDRWLQWNIDMLVWIIEQNGHKASSETTEPV